MALGCHYLYAAGDADTLRVKTVMEYAATHPVAVTGEDTDLLVLLCHHAQLSSRPIIFRSDRIESSNIQDLKEKLGEETMGLEYFLGKFSAYLLQVTEKGSFFLQGIL